MRRTGRRRLSPNVIGRVLSGRSGVFLLVAAAAATATFGLIAPTSADARATGAAASAATTDDLLGAELFRTQCSSCHGLNGLGVSDRGPSLESEGTASTDFVLRTGRMPLAAPDLQAKSGPVRYTESQIVALVGHVGRLGNGPDIPVVDPDLGNAANGGQLYRLNCAACHVASGAGAPIGGGRHAPNLVSSSATEIGEAILVGPGAMPVFGSLDSQEINDIASYIAVLDEEGTTSATSFGGAGPVAEGLAAFILGLIPLVALTRWIGTPKDGRDHPLDRRDDLDDMAHPIDETADAENGAVTA